MDAFEKIFVTCRRIEIEIRVRRSLASFKIRAAQAVRSMHDDGIELQWRLKGGFEDLFSNSPSTTKLCCRY